MNRRRRRLLIRAGQWLGTMLLLLAGVLLLGREVLFTGPYQKVSALPDSGIIDLHCHVAGIGAGDSGCFISPELRRNFRFRIYLEAFGVTEKEVEEHGDALIPKRISERVAESRHVGKVVLLAMDGVMDPDGRLDTNRTEVYVPNEFVAAASVRWTNLLFGASIHPRRSDALERLDWAAAHGAVLVKWLPPIMDIDPADPANIPFFDRMRTHNMPLLTHTGLERSFTTAKEDLGDPLRLRLALEHGVTVIAAHAAWDGEHEEERNFLRLLRLMREFPNLHADISSLTQVNKIGALAEVLSAEECRGRLVYGSDFPLINTVLVSPWYFPLALTERQRQDLVAISNPWDQDVRLKQALGVPSDVFLRGSKLLRHTGDKL